MKLTLTLLTALLLAPLAALHAAEANKPNIIVIMTDNHGWSDLGVQGVDAHIAKHLHAKLDTWLATLIPPGPPRPLVREEGCIGSGILPGKANTN